ncbi:hypothetical protein, partial [Burkholderia contaminans]|uniref:hypothetical protein n=1 Tax=Burkholderia contaminans TaxID=488447 RepID=UPI001C7291D9
AADGKIEPQDWMPNAYRKTLPRPFAGAPLAAAGAAPRAPAGSGNPDEAAFAASAALAASVASTFFL